MRRRRHKTATAKQMSNQHKRLWFVFFLFAVLLGSVFVRLFFVQILGHEKYRTLALQQHYSEKDILPKRGIIYLSASDHLYPSGINREYFQAFLSPHDVSEAQIDEVTHHIMEVFDSTEGEIRHKLAKRNDQYEIIKHKISKEKKEEIRAKKITGLHFLPENHRFYPGESLAAHVIGFVGSDGEVYKGRYGIEAYFEDELSGDKGFLQQERDARGGWLSIADRTLQPEKDGMDIVLTIDHGVQENVERILQEDMERYNAEAGTVIVVNPHNGDIIAMANAPTYSLNAYNEVEDINHFINTAVSDTYESGSVFKTITMAIGLDVGKITPITTYVDTGSVNIGGYTIRNSEGKVYGLQTMTYALEESINTAVIDVEKRVGNKVFKEYVERFGFGKKTGITVPAESSGNIRNLKNVRQDIEYYTASFGQGITVTPIQLAMAYSAFANGGIVVAPRIVKELISHDTPEEELQSIEPRVVHRVISESASKDVTKMLEKVVSGGHAKLAAVPGYSVAGKTGTAQVVDSETGTYFDDSRKNATFVGYAPAEDPAYVVLVKYNNPRDAEWAATSASPTFGRIMKFLLEYYNVPATKLSSEIVIE